MNKKTLGLTLLSVLLLSLFAMPFIANAADKTLQTIVDNVASQLRLLAAGLSTIAFIVAGIMFLSATANPARMTVAKGSLIAGIIGIVIIILAPVAQAFVQKLFFGT